MTVIINSKPERRYPVMCAWCGRLVGWSIVEHSHSICRECSEQLIDVTVKYRDERR